MCDHARECLTRQRLSGSSWALGDRSQGWFQRGCVPGWIRLCLLTFSPPRLPLHPEGWHFPPKHSCGNARLAWMDSGLCLMASV